MGIGRALGLPLTTQIFGFVKHKAMLFKDCTEQNDTQNGRNLEIVTFNRMDERLSMRKSLLCNERIRHLKKLPDSS